MGVRGGSGRRMLHDGNEVVKWTTAVAIETALASHTALHPISVGQILDTLLFNRHLCHTFLFVMY